MAVGLASRGDFTSMMITALELHRWLRGRHDVPEPSVDRIITGDPATSVAGIAVVWTPTWQALREALAQGCNVVVAHEPTYFAHRECDGFEAEFAHVPPLAKQAIVTTAQAKRQWIEQNAMVVIRCHDVLDAMPGGVGDSLARALGFAPETYLNSVGPHRVVRVEPPVAAVELARRLAEALLEVGQPGVAFYGDAARTVGSLGLGTGYACEPWTFVELGAEMCVTIDDRIKTWTETEWADDAGFPMVVIHHGTSEEWGVRRLREIIAEQFPELGVKLLPQGFRCRWISPTGQKG